MLFCCFAIATSHARILTGIPQVTRESVRRGTEMRLRSVGKVEHDELYIYEMIVQAILF